MSISGYTATSYEKTVGNLHIRIERVRGSGKWRALLNLSGIDIGGSIEMDRPGEVMDWVSDNADRIATGG